MPNNLKRPRYLKPHVVRIVGRAGDPGWGLLMTRKRHLSDGQTVVDVLHVREHGPFAGWVTTQPIENVRRANQIDVPVAVLDKLVEAGGITKGERRSMLAERNKALREALLRRNVTVGVTRQAAGSRVPSRVGAGQLSREHWRIAR